MNNDDKIRRMHLDPTPAEVVIMQNRLPAVQTANPGASAEEITEILRNYIYDLRDKAGKKREFP